MEDIKKFVKGLLRKLGKLLLPQSYHDAASLQRAQEIVNLTNHLHAEVKARKQAYAHIDYLETVVALHDNSLDFLSKILRKFILKISSLMIPSIIRQVLTSIVLLIIGAYTINIKGLTRAWHC